MKKTLSYLPAHKTTELKEIVSIIKDKAKSKVEMVILFGSYARGNWVEDRYKEGGITYEYKSDFDILLVVNNNRIVHDYFFWDKVELKIDQNEGIETDTSIIIHDIKDLNKKISKGEYFFTDIKNEGILLYDSKQFKLARKRKLKPKERREIAQEDFDYWFESSNEF